MKECADQEEYGTTQGSTTVKSQSCSRPRTAHAPSNAANKDRPAYRPSSAGAKDSGRVYRLQETWHPAGVQGIGSIDSPKRPLSAAAGSPASTRATLEQLKAQLSSVAAGSNLQLRSLRPTAPIDAGLALQAQVLDQLAALDASLTYSQARTAAADNAHQHADQGQQLQQAANTVQRLGWQRQDTRRRGLQPNLSSISASASRRGRLEQSSLQAQAQADCSAAATQDPEAAAAAAAQALAEMRQWAIDQELSMMDRNTVGRYASKALAAHVGMMQSEALVLQYQRQFFEAELCKLRARPGFAEQPPPSCKDRTCVSSLQSEPTNAASEDDTFPGWAAGDHQHAATPFSPGAAWLEAGEHSAATSRKSGADSCAACDHDNTWLHGPSPPVSAGHSDRGSLGQLQAGTATSTCMNAPHGKCFLGSHSLMPSVSGRLESSSSSSVLQMTHVGLGPKHLDKLQTALEAAPSPVQQIDLSSNLLTDTAVYDLVQMLQSLPAAAEVSHLDLSQNQLLTWRCCTALGQLLSVAAAAAMPVQLDCSSSRGGHTSSMPHAASAASAQCSTARLSVHQTPREAAPRAAYEAGTAPDGCGAHAPPAGWARPQPSFKQMVQPLQLQALLLQGVSIGDKGAELLAAALAGTQHLQVLNLSHCGLNDTGGAAICSALLQQDTMCELHLSWNALSSMTAKALEAVVRRLECCLTHLHISHCGLSDCDGALILNALVEAATCQSRRHSGLPAVPPLALGWQLLDLSHNSLEGGAALCAGALLTAEARAGDGGSAGQPKISNSDTNTMSSGSNGHKSGSGGGSYGAGNSGSKLLNLDGNPLGASGVHILMRALAAQAEFSSSSTAGRQTGATTGDGRSGPGACMGPSAGAEAQTAGADFFLPVVGVGTSQQQQHQEPHSQETGQHGLCTFVSIAKVSLLAKEKGFRSSMRAAEAAQVFSSQVPSLVHAVAVPAKPQAKGISKAPPKAPNAPSAVAAAAAAASSALSIIKETAAGFNLCCPAGQYQLLLKHPAARHLFDQLLALRAGQQQLQQLVKARQQHQQQQQAAAPSVPQEVTAGPQALAASKAQPQRGSRSSSPLPVESVPLSRAASSHPTGEASPPAPASRRVSRTASTLAAAGASASRPVPKRRVQPCTVHVSNLELVKLDGKAVKLEQLLQLAPWYKPQQLPADQPPASGLESEVQVDPSSSVSTTGSAAGAAAAAHGAGGQAGKKKIRSYRVVEFSVKAAAVLTGREPPVMPAGLLQWALQVLADTSCGDVWKLHLVDLLLQDWLLAPQQAVKLLNVFDKELGRDEQLLAAGLMWAHLVQPMQLWQDVVPLVLRPSQQRQLKRMLGPALMAFDRHNLTGPFSLDLSSSIHRAVAWRLQLAALQDNATCECRYFLPWRNATLNSASLSEDALAHLQVYAIPCSGTLKLDYVNYQAPDASLPPVPHAHLQQLLADLRRQQRQYSMLVLSLRKEYLPGGVRRSHEEAKAAAARAREARDTGGKCDRSTSHRVAQRRTEGTGPALKQVPACLTSDGSQQALASTTAVASEQPQAVEQGGPRAWWAATGFKGEELLVKYLPRPASATAGNAKGGPRGRRATRDAAGGRRSHALASRKDSTSSRPGSAAVAPLNARAPTSSVASARTSTAGAGADAVASRRRNRSTKTLGPAATRSKNPGSGQVDGSGPGSQGVTDEQLLARLLAADSPSDVAAAFARMGSNHAVAVLQLLAGKDKGPAAVAALLQCLPPVVAARLLHDLPGHAASLLPAEVRAEVQPLLAPAVAECTHEVAGHLKDAARLRDSQQLLCVRQWASQVSGLTCSQLVTVLQLLRAQGGHLRCGVIVALWGKVLDRHNLVKVFEALSSSEQLGLMAALGSYYVWSSLGAPDGLHFRLDLTQPEQRDVAREVVKVAVRRTLAAGKGSGVQHLVNFTAEGKPVADPEDDKLWLSLESKHTLLEFDFARTWAQELHMMEDAVKRIQRAWRSRTAARLAALHDSTSTSCYLSTTGSRGDCDGGTVAAGRLSPTLTAPSTTSQGGRSLQPAAGLQDSSNSGTLLGSSYTTDSYSSYSYYSLVEPSCSMSLQPSQGLVSVGGGPHSLEPSSTSVCEGGGSTSVNTLQGRSSFEDGAGGRRAAAGSSSASRMQQHGVSGTMPGSLGGDVRDSVAAAGSSMTAPNRGVDLAASLASFKAAGHIPTSLEPTPRLVSNAGR